MKRAAAGVALASLLLAGCGSTVQVQSSSVVGGAGTTGDALSGATGTGTGSTTGSTGVALPQGSGGTTSGSGTTGGTAQPGQSAGSGGTTGGSVGGSISPKDPIKIGVITQPGLEQAARTFGLDGVTTGDTKKQVDAVLAWIRTHGGLGGHPVEVFEYPVDMSDSSAEVWQNNACAALAQDRKVRFVVTVLANLQPLAACLTKHGVGLLADNTSFGDKTMAQYAPILGNPSELGQGRMMALLVDHLVSTRWLTPGSKIGILADDGPDGHATVDGALTAALRKHGLKATITQYINPKSGDGGSSQSSSAVLRFRTANVDRVLPVLYSPLYFAIAAESQGYYPSYSMVSAHGPGALLESTMPANQLKNAAGIGWAPYLDIGKGPKPPPVNARATLCFDLMRKAGQAASSALVKGFQAQVCDLLFYLKDLTDRLPDVPRDLLTSGRKLLGSSFVSPATYRVDVTNRTAGVAGYRPLAYLDSCECFQYTGGLVKAS